LLLIFLTPFSFLHFCFLNLISYLVFTIFDMLTQLSSIIKHLTSVKKIKKWNT
jgi:hypothetical protein